MPSTTCSPTATNVMCVTLTCQRRICLSCVNGTEISLCGLIAQSVHSTKMSLGAYFQKLLEVIQSTPTVFGTLYVCYTFVCDTSLIHVLCIGAGCQQTQTATAPSGSNTSTFHSRDRQDAWRLCESWCDGRRQTAHCLCDRPAVGNVVSSTSVVHRRHVLGGQTAIQSAFQPTCIPPKWR